MDTITHTVENSHLNLLKMNNNYNLNINNGTFNKDKLPNQTIIERKGYHLNTNTYELEEC